MHDFNLKSIIFKNDEMPLNPDRRGFEASGDDNINLIQIGKPGSDSFLKYITDSAYDYLSDEQLYDYFHPENNLAAPNPEIFETLENKVKNENRELYDHVTKTLGYGTIWALFRPIAREAERKEITSNEEEVKHLLKERFSLPYNNDAIYQPANVDGLLEPLESSSKFVEFTLDDKSIITFDGEGANHAANQFVRSYNNSQRFRDAIHHIADEQGGRYNFHLVDTGDDNYGYNVGGFGSDYLNSGVFIDHQFTTAEPDHDYLLLLMIHELSHDFHTQHHDHDLIELDSGSHHSREQSAWIAGILNQIQNSGDQINLELNYTEPSKNLTIFDEDFNEFDGTSNDGDTFTRGQTAYKNIKNEINIAGSEAELENALEIFKTIPAEETITTIHDDHIASYSATYNVRELILQELLMFADSEDYFNTDSGSDAKSKTDVSRFLVSLVKDDPSMISLINKAADNIGIDLLHDNPDYAGWLVFYGPELPSESESESESGTIIDKQPEASLF